jgi:hypothetical protein
MKRAECCFLMLFSLILLIPSSARGQAWSGIIDPSRAIDWTQAGIPGGIPNRTTQCGATIAAYSGSAAAINSAIAACPAGQYVNLGAGTFNLSSGIDFAGHNNVTVRGQGADQTFLVFTGSAGCNGLSGDVCMAGGNSYPGGESNVCDWTAGYSKGSTVLTLSNCGSTTPAKGSLSNLHAGSLLILDQLDEATDTGQIWNCSTQNSCANTIQGGAERTDGPCNGSMCLRSQEQTVLVTAISGSQITISPGVYMPNWRSSQHPQAWFGGVITGDGIENVSIDNTSSTAGHNVEIYGCYQCWVKGVRSIKANRSHVQVFESEHVVVRDNYVYQNLNHASVSYSIELSNTCDSLVENNISQQVTDSSPSTTGPACGNVAGYNFAIDDQWYSNGWMQPPFYQHASGDVYMLWEGNVGTGYDADSVHGTHHFHTLFRNYFSGTQDSPTTTCLTVGSCNQTTPIALAAGSRYFNLLGNVLGQAGYHNNYTCLASAATCLDNASSIYTLGYTGETTGQPNSSITGFCLVAPLCALFGDYDPLVATYLFRWGNWDVVHNSVQWNSSEVPASVSPYGNPVPASQTLPASFYLSAKPSWFGSVAWPAIGPDVSGASISAVAGHANMIPAMACYMNVMGGPADGTGNVLSFNAGTCYGQQVSTAPPPAAPTNLTAVVQ